jgi:hypothetical protein
LRERRGFIWAVCEGLREKGRGRGAVASMAEPFLHSLYDI